MDAKKIDPSDKAVVAHHSVVAKVYKELKKQEFGGGMSTRDDAG